MLLIAVGAVAVAASVARPVPAYASCAAVIVWHDTAYFGYSIRSTQVRPAPGARVDGAVAPGCDDTGGGTMSPTSVRARTVAGVPPQIALLAQGGIYIPAGELPHLSGFPVAFRPDPPLTCRVMEHLTVSGHAEPVAGDVVLTDVRASRHLRLADGRLFVSVRAGTRVTGLSRDGVVDIGTRQALRIDAVRCGHDIVATRIVPGGPIVPRATAEDVLGPNWRGGPGFFRDPTTWAAAAIVAIIALVILGVRAGRRPSAARRG